MFSHDYLFPYLKILPYLKANPIEIFSREFQLTWSTWTIREFIWSIQTMWNTYYKVIAIKSNEHNLPSHKSKLLIHSRLLQRYSSLFKSHGCVLFARKYQEKIVLILKNSNWRWRKAVRTTVKPWPLTFPPSVLPKKQQFK